MSLTGAGLIKTSLLDYPSKVAAVIFVPGCNFRCPWCHNPGLVIPPFDQSLTPWEEICDFLNKRKKVLGGVVISGGEPLMHPQIGDWLETIKTLGYKVKVDTNGSYPDRLQALAGLVDFVAMDIKNSPRDYGSSTGVTVDVEALSQSIELIKSRWPGAYQFRTTWVPGINQLSEIPDMAKLMGPGTTLTLQRFRPGELVDGELKKEKTLTSLEMDSVIQAFKKAGVRVEGAFDV